ncbi:hypothetical protein FLT15_17135 [Paenibacillus thiaminolyticus]|uniref:hypothetical protein n=1 Tax=Paenibacillus thiaminolyticus TaxID=49283 RepID=UPI0013F60DE9|nr:hypothetical protein [Paenibacillus thiaminolyticus]NGP60001.1 hypothetical protein [Paenibacillus thiaminolyticus]
MSKTTVINVGLYGGKGLLVGETPLEASIIYCDKYDKCSYYRNHQCLCVRSIGSSGCKFGRAITERGYTSRAKKYHEFRNKWTTNERYSKLKHPKDKLGLIDDVVVFPYPFIRVSDRDGQLKVESPSWSGSDTSFIPLDDFTPELIKQICSYRPMAVMGGEIKDYQKKIVPLFLSHLAEVIPDKYKEFTTEFPEYLKKHDYVGRKALLKSIAPSKVEYKSSNYPQFNEEWHWDGEKLKYQSGHVYEFRVTKDYDIEEITIIPRDNAIVTISDNNQVTFETVFID